MDPAPPAAKISFSLKAKPKSKTPNIPPQQVSAFSSLDDEGEAPTPKPTKNARPIAMVSTQSGMTKAMRREMDRQKRVDATVYQYDEVYDGLKEAERLEEIKKEEEARIRQPKYIGNLLQAADQRKRDYLIAEEKTIQRERELEGDEFADKEKFVTQAYKDQLAANRKAVEEERLREELEKKKKKSGPGLTGFYATLLQQSDQKHAAVIAGSKSVIGPGMPEGSTKFTIKPPERNELTDLERAQKAAAEGKNVELNEDNQIIDKRELLIAGLNLSGKNTRDLSTYKRQMGQKDEPAFVHTAVGSSANGREIDARRRRDVEIQMAEEEERRAREKERQEEENRQRAVKRKNDEDAVLSARERYLERKRRKLEQPTQEEDE
ncbi:hypothetical protein FRC20_010700 [Serendipita sp. 405]|nr:hypothetical protein FRC15_011795 [Serendipita sp. 397]KAG8863605.1 hypothetical protein FRC20_010700 [Serendipita sp. 405]